MQGLSTIQAQEALAQFGRNVLEEAKQRSLLGVLWEQLNNFLTYLLLCAVMLSFLVGETLDGVLILAIIILNAIFGIYQEAKASQAIATLRNMTTTKARVLRDDQEVEIDSSEIVPGDVVFVEEGIKIPADGVIEKALNLEINESALTGESLPITKSQSEELYMGTIVSRGRGYYKVTSTGMRSKFGQIAGKLEHVKEMHSPLQIKLEKVTKTIGLLGIAGSFTVFFLASFQGSSYLGAFLLAISLAVAVVPEGLPAVMTITLAIGVKQMAKKKAIIRKLTAIETLGSITLIATDKTGTLTTNKMKVKEVFISGHRHQELQNLTNAQNEPFSLMLLNGILCSTATVNRTPSGSFDVLGDPTEGALLIMAEEHGLIHQEIRDNWKLLEEVPFDSVSKKMSVLVQNGQTIHHFTKGAPESVLALCTHILSEDQVQTLSEETETKIQQILHMWASQGLRVLAFSYEDKSHNLSHGQTFLGMVAIYDAPRPEAKAAVSRAQSAGIEVVMITGDNERTAAAIGRDAGIFREGDSILTGSELETLTDEALMEKLSKTRIFARTTPFHKHRIVSLYQKLGEIVAVTGDGVNDAIALKQANVGIAMGLVGTDVARETADMVITDDNFATIVDAIEEGRNIIKNLKNAIAYLLSCNFTEALSLILGLLLGFPHIFTAIQLLYINLVTDGVPALALAFSPRDGKLMQRPPEKKLSLLSKRDLTYISSIGVIATILVVTSFWYFSRSNMGLAQAVAFSVLALVQSFIFVDVWLSRRTRLSNFHKLRSPLFVVTFLVPFLLQYFIVTVGPLAGVFKVSNMSSTTFALCILIASLVIVALLGQRKLGKALRVG